MRPKKWEENIWEEECDIEKHINCLFWRKPEFWGLSSMYFAVKHPFYFESCMGDMAS